MVSPVSVKADGGLWDEQRREASCRWHAMLSGIRFSLWIPTTVTEMWLMSERLVTCLRLSSKGRTNRPVWRQVCCVPATVLLTPCPPHKPALQCPSRQGSNSLMAWSKSIFLALHPTAKKANAGFFFFFFCFYSCKFPIPGEQLAFLVFPG